jgi:hypothetical protein
MRALAKRKIDEITANAMTNCENYLFKMPEPTAVSATTKAVKGAIEP